jgi:hypothetical protein
VKNISTLYHGIIRRNLWIIQENNYMEVGSLESLDDEFVAELRQSRNEMLAFLKSGRNVPVLVALARQIAMGEFDCLSKQARESHFENLKPIEHPICREALEYLLTRQ